MNGFPQFPFFNNDFEKVDCVSLGDHQTKKGQAQQLHFDFLSSFLKLVAKIFALFL
jgi:hypothetical protein